MTRYLASFCLYNIRECLNVGTVPMFKMHNVGTVPTWCILNVGTVPTFKMHHVED